MSIYSLVLLIVFAPLMVIAAVNAGKWCVKATAGITKTVGGDTRKRG
jgi:hypothetical protein